MVTTAPGTSVHAPICKYVLRKRSSRLLTITGVLVWLLTALSTNHGASSVKSWLAHFIMPHTLILAGAAWTTSVVPMLIIRRYGLTSLCLLCPTVLDLYARRSALGHRTDSRRVRSRDVLQDLHVAPDGRPRLVWRGGRVPARVRRLFQRRMAPPRPKARVLCPDKVTDASCEVTTRSDARRRYPYHLNERYIFTVLCVSCAGAVYAVKDILLQRNVVRWAPNVRPTSRPCVC